MAAATKLEGARIAEARQLVVQAQSKANEAAVALGEALLSGGSSGGS